MHGVNSIGLLGMTNDIFCNTLFSSQRCLTPHIISTMDTNKPKKEPAISTKNTPPRLLISKAKAPLSLSTPLSSKFHIFSVGSSMHGYGLSHSAGEMRPNMNILSETLTQDIPSHNHTSPENGDMNENNFGGSFIGLRNNIAIPKETFNDLFVHRKCCNTPFIMVMSYASIDFNGHLITCHSRRDPLLRTALSQLPIQARFLVRLNECQLYLRRYVDTAPNQEFEDPNH
ncbi:hypothetical protein GQX74_013045 [Glossina fuscipes]|nr:hypothetical protein GQX74_013045 [Glossina fuscipes]